MLENYINLITLMDNSFDAIMIIDKEMTIRYYKTFSKNRLEYVDEKNAIGKTPFDIFINITKENSTLYKAIKFKKITLNNNQIIHYSTGKKEAIIDNTIPIVINNKIIGAINTARYISNFNKTNLNNSSNILTPLLDNLYTINDIIGESEKTLDLKNKIIRVSQTNSNILIYGETGTGKEIVAQAIHNSSNRKNKLFISQNCAAIPNSLLESILFGTTKGSYTDAIDKPGLFELANEGTIFLDEINSMSLYTQAKLLRIIEEKKVTRIGGNIPKKINVRIIAAINKSPNICLKQKTLRDDLFYRLSSVLLKTCPLREKKEDINILISFFIKFFNLLFNKKISFVSEEVLDLFNNYDWPGNVRELKNSIETAFNFSNSDIITINDIPEYLKEFNKTESSFKKNNLNNNSDSLSSAVNSFEKEYIINCSKKSSSFSELANNSKISNQLLNYKIQKYNLKDILYKNFTQSRKKART